jgi:hypothetical protein
MARFTFFSTGRSPERNLIFSFCQIRPSLFLNIVRSKFALKREGSIITFAAGIQPMSKKFPAMQGMAPVKLKQRSRFAACR